MATGRVVDGQRSARHDQADVAREATDPARIADTRGARPRQERRIGRAREFGIRLGRDVEAPDQGIHQLVSHLRFSAP